MNIEQDIKRIKTELDNIYLGTENTLKFEEESTCRGFKMLKFKDDYGEMCNIQESSNVEPHIWLGTNEAKVKVLASTVVEGGTGWVEYQLPESASVSHRMHLTPEQCVVLGLKLLKYGLFEEL